MDAVVFIAVRGSFWATQFVLSPIRRLFWHKQLMGAYHKSRRDERLQTGVKPPVIARRLSKSRRDDRDRCKMKLNKLHVLSPFQGLVLLMRLCRGLTPPSVVFRTFGAY